MSKAFNLFFRRSKFSFNEKVVKLLQSVDEDEFVDIVVECADFKIVKAHRLLMSMHSKEFRQLLLLPGIEQRLVYCLGIIS